MTSCFRVDTIDVCAKAILLQVPKEPPKTHLIRNTKEAKSTKKVKKKKRLLANDAKEWQIKSTVKILNFKNFSSSFQVSSKRAQVGEDYSLVKPP